MNTERQNSSKRQKKPAAQRFYYRVVKRVLDIILAVLTLVLLSPLLLLAALSIKLESKGPVIFKQTRIGRNAKEFRIYKFRTMQVDSEHTGSGAYSDRRLFAPGSAAADLQSFFDDAFERAREYEVEHGAAKVWSMSPEDHLLYLILHAYKHFIHSGFGIRQVCDIGLWAKRYAGEVDHNHIMENLKKAHALYFAAAVFAIAQEDLGIDMQLPECWDAIKVDREPMLRDLLDAGVYGGSSMSRRHSAPLIQETVAASRENRKKSGLLRRAFPPKESLLRDYPELQEHPSKLPLVWVKRLAKYRKETKNDANNSAVESIRIAKEREELLRLYRII